MGKHEESMRGLLREGEELLASCPGTLSGDAWPGVLGVTPERIIFHRKGFFGSRTVVFERAKLGAVDVKVGGATKGSVRLSGPGGVVVFAAFSSDGIASVQRCL